METCENLPKSDHLILLVGSNPLPNAVAGLLLTAEKATITMIHSQDSHGIALNLKPWIEGKKPAVKIRMKEVDESDPVCIAKQVEEALQEIQSNSVGLHYTGGTKTMGVHAYRAVEQRAKEQQSRPRTHFSYLNARTLEMIIDPDDSASGASASKTCVGDKIQISLEELLALHGWELKPSPSCKPVLPGTAQALINLHAKGPQIWRDWKNEVLYDQCKIGQKANNNWKNQYDLNRLTLCLPTTGALAEVACAIHKELGQGGGNLCLQSAAGQCNYGVRTDEFCNWLDGKWLESALLAVLQECADTLNLHDALMNVKPLMRVTDFEFDVVAIRGYQLFAFSCSTARDTRGDRSRLKRKLFEAVIRARQMGGDEACVALVCCSNDPEGLQAETRNLFLDAGGDERIKVFGQQHLADLKKHTKAWIKQQSHS